MSTVTAPPVSTPRDDAIQLYRAFKGFGCDTAAVVNILAHRDASQRLGIQQEYGSMYSEDLNKRLSSELSSNVKKAVLLWMHDPAGRDATIVRQALTGDVIELQVATEVICSRTPSQIQQLKEIYGAKFGVDLVDDIEIQAFGDHRKLLLACVSAPRYEGIEVDRKMVENDAKALFKAGEKRLGTDENTFIRIFGERSRAHLASVSSVYQNMYGDSLEKEVRSLTSGNFRFAPLTILWPAENPAKNFAKSYLKSETSRNFKFGLLTILQCAENPAKYFAKALCKAMKGLGTDDTTLIRITVTRAEIDMQYIKAEYQKMYEKRLSDAVHSKTSGHYKTFLLSLLGPDH